eukprot:ANDGO_00142.mRNA.1 hypothetical protein EMIHUDRAFT_248861
MRSPRYCALLLALAVCCCFFRTVQADPVPPVWDPKFFVMVNQTITYETNVWKNTFEFFYDSMSQRSLTVHGQGQHDEVCNGVPSKKTSDEPCKLLNAADGWLYVIFPESNLCCQFCNASEYCTIISPTWLNGAAYVGQKTVDGHLCNGWMKKGGEENYYFATADARQLPCEYYEGYPTLDVGSNVWAYDLRTYVAGAYIFDSDEVFAVPSSMKCDQSCKGV